MTREYGVQDPFSAAESIAAGARLCADLMRRYPTTSRWSPPPTTPASARSPSYGGVPPYAETQAYVAKVDKLYHLYQAALHAAERRHARRALPAALSGLR